MSNTDSGTEDEGEQAWYEHIEAIKIDEDRLVEEHRKNTRRRATATEEMEVHIKLKPLTTPEEIDIVEASWKRDTGGRYPPGTRAIILRPRDFVDPDERRKITARRRVSVSVPSTTSCRSATNVINTRIE